MTYETRDNPHSKITKNWRAGHSSTKNKEQRGFGLVEKMFYYYHRIKKAVEEIRAEQGYYQSTGKTGGSSSNHAFISDPTAILVMKHCEPIAKVIISADKIDEEVVFNPEKWLTVVEQTFIFFEDEDLVNDVLRRRFFKNEHMLRTCCDLEINDNKYYRLRDAGILYARECAIQLGLIKIFNEKGKRPSQ